MIRITLEMPEGSLAVLRKDATAFASEIRLAAGVKWYEMGTVSQGRAAEIAGLPRAAFINALSRFGVSPFQSPADEILEEASRD